MPIRSAEPVPVKKLMSTFEIFSPSQYTDMYINRQNMFCPYCAGHLIRISYSVLVGDILRSDSSKNSVVDKKMELRELLEEVVTSLTLCILRTATFFWSFLERAITHMF